MLVEMDGIDTKEGVIVLASTNRPDVLDKVRDGFLHMLLDCLIELFKFVKFFDHYKCVNAYKYYFHGQ